MNAPHITAAEVLATHHEEEAIRQGDGAMRRESEASQEEKSQIVRVLSLRRRRSSAQLPPPPDGGYGWVCVACVLMINCHTWGIIGAYGIFLTYFLTNDIFPGGSTVDYAFVGGLSLATCLIIAPLPTYISQSYSNRLVLNIGAVLLSASLLAASWSTQLWHLFLSQGLCFGLGFGFLFVGSIPIIPQWFLRHRSVASGISVAGSGLGGLVYSLAAQSMLEKWGLPWTFRAFGIIAFAVNFVCANLMKDRNNLISIRKTPLYFSLLKRPEFVAYVSWGVFSMFAYIALLFSLPNFAQSVGISAQRASLVGAIFNLAQVIGRPSAGFLSDMFGRLNVSSILTWICALFCLIIWIFAKSEGVVFFFATAMGLVAGTFWATVSPVGAEVVGLRDLSSALSMNWVILSVPCAVSEVIALKLRRLDSPDNIYLYAQVFTGIMFVAAAISITLLRGWRAGQARRQNVELTDAVGTQQDDAGRRKMGYEIWALITNSVKPMYV